MDSVQTGSIPSQFLLQWEQTLLAFQQDGLYRPDPAAAGCIDRIRKRVLAKLIYRADTELGLIKANLSLLTNDQQLFIELQVTLTRELRQRHPLHFGNHMSNQEVELNIAVPSHLDLLCIGFQFVVTFGKRVKDMLIPG